MSGCETGTQFVQPETLGAPATNLNSATGSPASPFHLSDIRATKWSQLSGTLDFWVQLAPFQDGYQPIILSSGRSESNNLTATTVCCIFCSIPLVQFPTDTSGVASSHWASAGSSHPPNLRLWQKALLATTSFVEVSLFILPMGFNSHFRSLLVPETYFAPSLPHNVIFQYLDTKSQRGSFFAIHFPCQIE